ncbi:Response regulator receiver domain protein [Sulfitobacter noctilucicola]|uniref:CheY-like chemotaxis protein n=1 Tax=Sulfitobacter noctilucicola TaxID=1342301 RepID=A0A7W6Q500_9RHOB|nr:response regulator [Sulfitobacter noctilucicola]KIN63747.1 Response regulator receiver domain protein [Sulfitobacter noctilucicola]MBB4174744.1 CheY-like chemotaxis protein [Sulfitobacter noctilucicola]
MHIFVVDDDPLMLELLSETLREEDGFRLDMYASAEAGLAALDSKEETYDCMLLDIMLPGMDGVELCEVLRKSSRYVSTPILMITGSAEIGLMDRAFKAGATDFILKPFNQNELKARVNMAGMLNQSLAVSSHTMRELTERMKIRFEEPLDLAIPGMCNALALENELLRYRAGCFAMTMFSFEVIGLRGIYRSVRTPAFRTCLDLIGKAAVDMLKNYNARLAYIGRGRFVGVIMDRNRHERDFLSAALNRKLAKIWDVGATGVPVPPETQFSAIAAQRLWSGISAGDMLRVFVDASGSLGDLTEDDENDLFARLDKELTQVPK